MEQFQKKQVMLASEAILSYLIGNKDELDTLVMCKSSEFDIITTELNLYEALGSIKPYDDFKLNKLVKLLEVTTVTAANRKSILKENRVEQLRKLALGE